MFQFLEKVYVSDHVKSFCTIGLPSALTSIPLLVTKPRFSTRPVYPVEGLMGTVNIWPSVLLSYTATSNPNLFFQNLISVPSSASEVMIGFRFWLPRVLAIPKALTPLNGKVIEPNGRLTFPILRLDKRRTEVHLNLSYHMPP